MSNVVPRWRDLRLGIFFLVATVILTYALLVVGTNQHIFERSYKLMLSMNNSQGLTKGAMVSLSGLEVGRVRDITFAENDTANVLQMTLSINQEHRNRITLSSVATVRTVGVLGDKFIDISLGESGEPPLPEGSSLPVRGEIDWTATFERVSLALDDFVLLTANAATLLGSFNEGEGAFGALLNDPNTGRQVREVAADLAVVTARLRGGDGTLSKLLREDQAYEDIESILARLDMLAAKADTGNGALARMLSDKEMGERLDHLVMQSDSLITAIRTQGTTGRLVQDETLYRDMAGSLEELQALLADIRDNPRKYFKVSVF